MCRQQILNIPCMTELFDKTSLAYQIIKSVVFSPQDQVVDDTYVYNVSSTLVT